MKQPSPDRGITSWLAAGGVLAAHALALAVGGRYRSLISSLFLLAAPLMTTAAAWHRGRMAGQQVRRPWYLLSVASATWSIGMLIAIVEQFVFKTPGDVGAPSQIFFFLYGVPMLLSLYCVIDSPRRALFVALDALQIALMTFLVYMVVFDVVPFAGMPIHPVPADSIVRTFNVENLVLSAAAVLRFFGSRPKSEERHMHGALGSFLWIYAAAAGYYNTLSGDTGYMDLLVDVPFLVLIGILLSPVSLRLPKPMLYVPSMALLLDNAMPALFPGAVVALGIVVASNHFSSGAVCVVAGFAIFGLRSTMVQLEYQRARSAANEARDSMRTLAITDSLTQVYNRRHFDLQLQEEWNRASRQCNHISLLMIDIDYFKFINDNFGHSDGDVCLRQVASALKSCLQREFDILARYGGEEFAAVLPQTDRAGAEIVARRMRLIVSDLRLRNRTPIGTTVTISIGAATRQPGDEGTPQLLVEAADRALYRAKRSGRNCTQFEPMRTQASPVAADAVLV